MEGMKSRRNEVDLNEEYCCETDPYSLEHIKKVFWQSLKVVEVWLVYEYDTKMIPN